jgi:ubiquinone/menaquinone biosynthesis C-methylase UbiE
MNCFVCPWYIGYFLINPLRKLMQDPYKILKEHIKPGMKILEIGPGMGFFSIPMADLTGDGGKIYAVDIQENMLSVLVKRARKKNQAGRIETITCTKESLNISGLSGQIDFALLFAVVHELPDKNSLFKQVYDSLKTGGKVLISEPKGHVTDKNFTASIQTAENIGFKVSGTPEIKGSKSVLLSK